MQIGTSQARAGSREMLQTGEYDYLENIKNIVVVNVPRIFTSVYNIVRPLIPKATWKNGAPGTRYRKMEIGLSRRVPIPI